LAASLRIFFEALQENQEGMVFREEMVFQEQQAIQEILEKMGETGGTVHKEPKV
jgi:hypothetical protein